MKQRALHGPSAENDDGNSRGAHRRSGCGELLEFEGRPDENDHGSCDKISRPPGGTAHAAPPVQQLPRWEDAGRLLVQGSKCANRGVTERSGPPESLKQKDSHPGKRDENKQFRSLVLSSSRNLEGSRLSLPL